jgi:hypothetical protein
MLPYKFKPDRDFGSPQDKGKDVGSNVQDRASGMFYVDGIGSAGRNLQS